MDEPAAPKPEPPPKPQAPAASDKPTPDRSPAKGPVATARKVVKQVQAKVEEKKNGLPLGLIAAGVTVVGAVVIGLVLRKGSGKGDKERKDSNSRGLENGRVLSRGLDDSEMNGVLPSVPEEQEGEEAGEVGSKPGEGAKGGQEAGSRSEEGTGFGTPAALAVSVGHSPFNTAPNSPLHPPDSPYHDAAGDLDFEDHHLEGPTNAGGSKAGASERGIPNGGQDRGDEDSNGSNLTSESREQNSSVGSLENERASVQALLARAKAAAARVDKMHASINAMVNDKE